MENHNTPSDFDVRSLASALSYEASVHSESESTPSSRKPERDDVVEEQQAIGGLAGIGMLCDTKDLWEGPEKCPCCINWVEEYPEDVTPNLEETEAVQRFALLVRNKRSHKGEGGKAMHVSSIVVQSPFLKSVLEKVFEDYEGITAGLKQLTFHKPFTPFFYRWELFKKALEDEDDETTRSHLQLLYNILRHELDETINTHHDLINHGVMTYDYLWTLFKPGDTIICHMAGQDMMMKLQSSEYQHEFGCYSLLCKYIDWNGWHFGYASKQFTLRSFKGTKPIAELSAYPAQFNPDAKSIEEKLAVRGRKFEALQGYHFKAYNGIAEIGASSFGTHSFRSSQRTIEGRIIIHAETYNHFNTGDRAIVEPLNGTSFAPRIPTIVENVHGDPPPPPPPGPYGCMPPPPPPPGIMMHRGPQRLPPAPISYTADQVESSKTLAEDLYPICSPIVRGYALKTKQWAKFIVDDIEDIVWDERAFDSLVLPAGYKDLILSFTRNQAPNKDVFDDVIEGKGQGMVMLLTGEPGVGKTLTAESVAEHMRVPLYSMSAAELGVDSASVEEALGDILEMTQKWKAILLLDETEVFLEQRTIDGLERNKLVSIFLRMLEYYRGVLFLTTNRVTVLDKALESRIHLKISYPELDRPARMQIWRTLIQSLPPALVALDDDDLEVLSQKKINGRQIKNVIKAAQLLASEQRKPLNLEHVRIVLQITQIGEEYGIQV